MSEAEERYSGEFFGLRGRERGGEGRGREREKERRKKNSTSVHLLLSTTATATTTANLSHPPPLHSGALLTLGFTNALIVLSILTLPGVLIVFFVLPDVVGRAGPARQVSWSPRELFCFSRGVTVTTTLLLLQNAAQFLWLQVPVEDLILSF